jgi:hypothetical protein
MLGAVIMALTLEGVLPGLGRIRRPVAVVRYDRVREARVRANLRRLARRLSRADLPEPTSTFSDCRSPATHSSSRSTGARTVIFTG